MTKRTLQSCLFALLAAGLLFAGQARAYLLEFDPAAQNVVLGSPVSVDIMISGLGNLQAPSLSAFDLEVNFDTAILSPSILAFGTGLDVLGLGGNPRGVTGPILGTLGVFELSLDFADDLINLQPDSFLLFTLTFATIGTGTSDLTFSNVMLSDENGNLFESENDRMTSGSITVIRDGVVVPEPATLALMGLGLAGFGVARRRRKA